MTLYAYATPNAQLIEDLGLQKHPEGGYFAETDRQSATVPSPFADGAARSLATSIYYLLCPDSPVGFLHMNKSVTYHILHQGRAEYTLIHPGTAGGPARVERVIMGTDASRGEQRQLLVGTGVWKKSRVPAADLARGVRESTGCLITEVVVPGFAWEDHAYLTAAGLAALLAGHPDEPALAAELGASVKG